MILCRTPFCREQLWRLVQAFAAAVLGWAPRALLGERRPYTALLRPTAFMSGPLVLRGCLGGGAETRGFRVPLLAPALWPAMVIPPLGCVLMVGVLLVFALVMPPAATAEHLTHRPLTGIILSV